VVNFQRLEVQFGIFFEEIRDQGFYILTVFTPITVKIDGRNGANRRRQIAAG